MGSGAHFQAGQFAPSLDLVPDSATHGCIAPAQYVSLGQYESDLATTRPDWRIGRELNMTRQPLAMSPDYLAVARGVRELHKLTVTADQDESPEADAIRDAADGPVGKGLSETERNRGEGTIRRTFTPSVIRLPSEPLPTNPQAQARLAERD